MEKLQILTKFDHKNCGNDEKSKEESENEKFGSNVHFPLGILGYIHTTVTVG